MAAFAPVLAVAALMRLYDLSHGHPGLAIYTSISSHAYKSFHNWLYPNMFADGSILADKPPLFFWYQGLFIALLGPSNLSFRLPVAIAGICSVVLIYVIVRRCSGTLPALIAAAALAVMPLDVNYSRATFIEPVTTATMMFAAYFVVRAVQEKRERFYYVGAFILGLAFMVKLWQGLLPAPAFALLALAYRWQPWPSLVRAGLKCAAVFLVTAFWWPTLVWLTPGAYDAVMHADNVWDMIFGWNLLERYGELEYGARHRRDILWFVTGPMSVYFGASLFPAALLGVFAVLGGGWNRAWEFGARHWSTVSCRFPGLADRARSYVGPVWTRRLSRSAPADALPGLDLGVLWLVWFGVGRIGFDQIDIPGFTGPEPTLEEQRKQRQGALITAIVRTEFDQLEAALEYVRQRRGDARYILASDTYNTGAMVALITGEPVLPLFSEYKMVPLIDDAEFKRLLDEGEIPFILTTSHMLYMDFDLYTRMRTSSLDVTTRSGLPRDGEMELLRVTDW